jgi:hypothetical protein
LLKQTNALVKRLLKQFEKPEGAPNAKPATIRLPDIPLPTFSGNHNEWVYYRERFTALISTNETLKDFQKLHYLRASLKDEAAMLQSSNDTFNSLWSALTKRYEIKRIFVERHVNELFNLKALVRESSADLRHIIDTLLKNIRVLETLELTKNELSEQLIINLVCNKLDSETRKAFELQLKPENL